MRPGYKLSGGIRKFAKAHPDKDSRLIVKEAFDAKPGDVAGWLAVAEVESSVISHFSDCTRQLNAGAMVPLET